MQGSTLISNIYRWRIRSALVGVFVCLILARPTVRALLIGIGISILGLLLRAWASCHLRKDTDLAVCGPYRFTRNPLYLGNFLLGVSIAVGSHSLWVAAVFAVYFLIFYPVAIHVEKKKMEQIFPEEYRIYAQRVPIFFPRLFPAPRIGNSPFSLKRYSTNKEQRALVGTFLFWTVLVAKYLVL
ncbi:MAG: isoprenylcysteine carboxylmethyltransferase family protein [Candidatus Aminicenantes bacterium]|nr:isoprenylcysteine carboxylmethyltransferase family protein [Candidatus Aminicenantes bacterium]